MQFDQSTRREFIALLCGAAAWLLAARAQQPAMPVVGFLNTRVPGADPHLLAAFRQGLKESGDIECQNVIGAVVHFGFNKQVEQSCLLALE